jgi:hypothetical protein
MLHSRSPKWIVLPRLSARYLKLDMPRILDQLLQVDLVIAECAGGFTAGRTQRAQKLGFAMTARIPLPPPPALALIISG